jgi:hypothetical protein
MQQQQSKSENRESRYGARMNTLLHIELVANTEYLQVVWHLSNLSPRIFRSLTWKEAALSSSLVALKTPELEDSPVNSTV